MKKLLSLVALAAMVCSCSTWPKVYLGESDGWLTYQNGTKSLEVHWSRSTSIAGPTADSMKVDSVKVLEIVN